MDTCQNGKPWQYYGHFSEFIWAVFPSHNIFLLQLKKMRILEPSGRVLLCLKNKNCLLIPKIQVWTHQDLKDPNFYIKV